MLKGLSLNQPSTFVNTLIMLAIMFGLPCLTPPEGLSQQGLIVGAIFLGTLYGWITVDLVWPSILGLLVLAFGTDQAVNQVLGKAFGNQTVLLLIFFSMVASIVNSAGIAEYTARKICATPIVRGRPYVLLFMLSMSMVALATMLSMTAAVLVAYPLIKEVARQYGYEPGEKWPQMAIICVSYVGELAYMLLPFKSIPAVVFGIYSEFSHNIINYAAYVGVVFLIVVLGTLAMIVVFKYIVRPDVSRIMASSEVMKYDEKLTTYQKIILWSFVVLIVLMLWPNVMPRSWGITKFLASLSTNGLLLCYVAFYILLNFRNGINMQKIMTMSVPWQAIFLVLSVLTITGAFTAAGINKWLGMIVEPILIGHSGYIVVLSFIIITVTFTQFTNNIATSATMAPLACAIGTAAGLTDPQLQGLLTCIILSATLGVATPASSTIAAIMYGDTEWMSRRIIVQYAIVLWAISIVLLGTVGYWVSSWVF